MDFILLGDETGGCMKKQKRMNQKYLTAVIKSSRVEVFEYYPEKDKLILYDERMQKVKEICNYLVYLKKDTMIHPEDRKKAAAFFSGKREKILEVRTIEENRIHTKEITMTPVSEKEVPLCCVGCIRDVTLEKKKEKDMEELAKKDSLTGLYNHFWGEKMISGYLDNKDSDCPCGMLLVDIDNFKIVNDTYGHLFGDKVLIELSKLFDCIFCKKDIVVRFGGDEFILFLKDIDHASFVAKIMEMTESIRKLVFEENDYSMTCSTGGCFLPENTFGFTYKQVFENADRALYKAKERGRNQYVLWNALKQEEENGNVPGIEEKNK